MQVWELLICDPTRSFEYAQYFPNNKINSGEVRGGAGTALWQWASAVALPGGRTGGR